MELRITITTIRRRNAAMLGISWAMGLLSVNFLMVRGLMGEYWQFFFSFK